MKLVVSGDTNCLRIDAVRRGTSYGIDILDPFREGALDNAMDVLLSSLAGTSKAEISIAIARHLSTLE